MQWRRVRVASNHNGADDYPLQLGMHKYRLVRTGSDVGVFVDGNPTTTVDANKRNELRDYMASTGLTPDEINQKVHELYMTNTAEFLGSQ